MSDQGPKWQDLPLGGLIIHAGNAVQYETGGWRAFRPLINWKSTPSRKGCTGCLLCWLYCPEGAMIVTNGEFTGVDLNYCKGCALCEQVCPVKCIEMVKEGEVG